MEKIAILNKLKSMLIVCTECGYPYDEDHIEKNGKCVCIMNDVHSGDWKDVGYNKAIKEVYQFIKKQYNEEKFNTRLVSIKPKNTEIIFFEQD